MFARNCTAKTAGMGATNILRHPITSPLAVRSSIVRLGGAVSRSM